MAKRVVVTGIGVITAIGTGKEAFWRAALEGRSGASRLDHLPWMRERGESFRCRIGAPVRDFDPTRHGLRAHETAHLDRVTQFALAAAQMALEDAALVPELVDAKRGFHRVAGLEPQRFATVIGTGIGGLSSFERSHRAWAAGVPRESLKRYWLLMLIPNAPAAHVSIRFQARGECKTVSTACASGTMAIGDAHRLVAQGEADAVLAGGADAVLSDEDGYGLMGFDLLRALSERNDDPEHASRPFDRDRDGFVLSEGAGVLLLEERERARERGARIYAEVAGYRSSSSAYHMVTLEPDVAPLARLLEEALAGAGMRGEELDYINAHGTSTVPNDRAESLAIRKAFGPHADRLLVNSTKSMVGHAMGGAGGIEAAATVLAIHGGVVHPTINLVAPSPECDLNYCPGQAVKADIRVALSSSFGFGGHNAALLFRRHHGS